MLLLPGSTSIFTLLTLNIFHLNLLRVLEFTLFFPSLGILSFENGIWALVLDMLVQYSHCLQFSFFMIQIVLHAKLSL